MMKKIIVSVFILVFSVSLSLSFFLFTDKKSDSIEKINVSEKTDVITVADNGANTPDEAKVLESRFLNMLNHSFVYNDDFYSVDALVNSSMPALLDLRDSEDDSYIKEIYVADYLYNMYGIEIADLSEVNSEYGKKDGYIYIVPMGFEVYNHSIVNITENEDGSFTVKTKVEISSHDGIVSTETCESLFIQNEDSLFGYNILYSEFITENKMM